MTSASSSGPLYGLAHPSRRRWTPLRAGITGLFRYDDQVFTFHRGRLLLRGNNGTGKSMALEVLLPFVLDADLAPERLSTFGTRDRGMFVWLLGHDENHERSSARAYVWVEFGRLTEDGQEFYTVGAGLQGTRASKRVHPWYFTTAGRVGYDFELGAAGAEAKSETQLSSALAEMTANGLVGQVRSAEDHRLEVNRVLYGLDDHQYEALRKTMLHLRKPKLSDKLSEGKVDELLRDSLPPVNHEVTDELADGFERLARHREVIGDLTSAHAALAELVRAYSGYLNTVIGLRATDVIEAHRQVDEASQLVTTAVTEESKARSDLKQAQRQIESIRKGVRSLKTEIEAVKELDLYKDGAQLVPLREKAAALHESAKINRAQTLELQVEATNSKSAAATAQQEADTADGHRDKQAAYANSFAQRLPDRTLQQLVSNLIAQISESSPDVDSALAELRGAVETRTQEIAQLRSLVDRAHKATHFLKIVQGRTTKAKELLAAAGMKAEEARSAQRAEHADYLHAVSSWIGMSPQLVLGTAPPHTWPPDFPGRAVGAWRDNAAQNRRAMLTEERSMVEKIPPATDPLLQKATHLSDLCSALGSELTEAWARFCGARDARIDFANKVRHWALGLIELSKAVDVPEFMRTPVPRALTRADVADWAMTAATARSRALERQATTAGSELVSIDQTLSGKLAEHQRLSEGGLPELPVPHTRLVDRGSLYGAPFFLLVDFVANLDRGGDQRAMLEAALVGSGLSDAWVFPDGRIATGSDGGRFLDVQVTTEHPPSSSPLSNALRPDPALPTDGPVRAEVVRAVLARVRLTDTADGTSDGLTVAWDGTWAAGPLRGAYRKNSVDLIGAGSREATRLRRMAEVATEIDVLQVSRASLREQIKRFEGSLACVDRERATVPADHLVQTAEAQQAKAIDRTTALLYRISDESEMLAKAGSQVAANARRTFTFLDLPSDEPMAAGPTLATLAHDVTARLDSMADMVWANRPVEPDSVPVATAVQTIQTASSRWQQIRSRAVNALASITQCHTELDQQIRQLPSDAALTQSTQKVDVMTQMVKERSAELQTAQEEQATAATELNDAVTTKESALEVAGLSGYGERLDELRADTERFRSAAEDWINAESQLVRHKSLAIRETENANQAERIAKQAADRATTAEENASLAQRKYDDLNTQMGRSHQELMHKLDLLEVQWNTQASALNQRRTEESDLGRTAERRTLEAEHARTKAEEATLVLSTKAEALADVYRLGLVRTTGATERPTWFGPDQLRPDQLVEVCELARALHPRSHQSADQQDKAQTMTVQVRKRVEPALTGHVVLRERMDRRVFAISGSRNGHERPIHEILTALKQDVTHTEQLLEKEEAELFEKFLSDEVRLEVGQRIQAARSLVDHMNALMQDHPTSSGYRFKLRWEAAPDCEMPTDMMRLLEKPEGLLYPSERKRLSEFYRQRITGMRPAMTSLPWRVQLASMLDYRQWHRFDLLVKQSAGGAWGKLDRRRHGSMSGGEKAVALHMPLFAAAATHCEASKLLVHENGQESPGCPRLILLDEIFAGVDAENRGALFDLITRLDLDLVATSESELGLYPELDGISIYQLIVDDALPGVLAARSVWDGRTSHDMLEYDLNADT